MMPFCRWSATRKMDFLGMLSAGIFLVLISHRSNDGEIFVPIGFCMAALGSILFIASLFFGKENRDV